MKRMLASIGACAFALFTAAASSGGPVAPDRPTPLDGWVETCAGEAGWGGGGWAVSEGRTILRLQRQAAGTTVRHYRIDAAGWADGPMTLALSARVLDLQDAAPPKHTAKVLVKFEGEGRRAIGYQVLHPRTHGRWHLQSKTFEAPDGTLTIKLSPGLYEAAGRFEIDTMTLTPGAEAPDHASIDPRAEPAPDSDRFNVTRPPYRADPTGRRDSTAALQRAFRDAWARFRNQRPQDRRPIEIYFPQGVYLVRDTLDFGPGKPQHMHVIGDGSGRTVIRLAEASPGFGDRRKPRPVITFAGLGRFASNISFNNVVSGLTVEVGRDNPGAVGVRYHNNNTGYIEDLTIRSTDPQKRGHTGLEMPGELSGIARVRRVRVVGFDTGVAMRSRKIMYVLEDIELQGQRTAGLLSADKPVTIRRLVSDNQAPAVIGRGKHAQVVLLDSRLRGGSPDRAAIINQGGLLFARNIEIDGYGVAIDSNGEQVAGDRVDEFVSSGVLTLGSDPPTRSLNLPIRDAPAPPDDDPSTWAIVDGQAQGDDTAAIQAAIDSGASTVYLPGSYAVSDTLILRGGVRRLIGAAPGGIGVNNRVGLRPAGGLGRDKPVLRIETPTHEATWIERLNVSHCGWVYDNASDKALVIRDSVAGPYRNSGRGDVFFEGAVGGLGTSAYEMVRHPYVVITGQNAWFRHLNVEGAFPHLVNDGGRVVVLGAKFGEWHGPYLVTLNGGQTEVLGAVFNSIGPRSKPMRPWIVNDNSSVSVVAADDQIDSQSPHPLAVRQFDHGRESRLAVGQATPRGRRRALALYRGQVAHEPTGPYAWLEVAEPFQASADRANRLIVRLSRPAADDLAVRIALSESSVAGDDVFDHGTYTVRIPAGQPEAQATVFPHVQRESIQAAFRVTGGEGYRVHPDKDDAIMLMAGDGEDLGAGLLLHLDVQGQQLIDRSGKDRIVEPDGVTFEPIEGRDAMTFHGDRSRVVLRGKTSSGYKGFMREAFDARTIAGWVKTDMNGGVIFAEGGGFGGFELAVRDGELVFRTVAGNHARATLTVDWPVGDVWRAVAAVFSHGVHQLYVDGELVDQQTMPGYVIPRHSAEGGLGRGGFRGSLSDIRLYHRALTPREISRLATHAALRRDEP